MNESVTLRTALALTVVLVLLPLVLSTAPVAANNHPDVDDNILGVWRWEWTNNRDYTRKDCAGGFGTMTVTKESISFKGKYRQVDGPDVEFSNSGSWEFAGEDPANYNRRKYLLHWSNDTDTVIMGDAGTYLRGTNGSGKCLVSGRKQSAK